MRKFAPFLKLYSEYVKNFDCAMKMIKFWCERSPRFGRLILDIQVIKFASGPNQHMCMHIFVMNGKSHFFQGLKIRQTFIKEN